MTLGPILNVLKYVPATAARKVLTKFDPRFGKYFSSAIGYGLDANRALDYLIDRFENDQQKDYRKQLEKGNLRPDQAVSRSQMANAAIPGKIAKAGIGFATGGLLGGIGENAPEQEEQPPEQPQANLPQATTMLRPLETPQPTGKNQISPANPQASKQQFAQKYGATIQDELAKAKAQGPTNTGSYGPLEDLAQYSPQLAKKMETRSKIDPNPIESAKVIANAVPNKELVNKFKKDTGENFIEWVDKRFTAAPTATPQGQSSKRQAVIAELAKLTERLGK